MGKNMTQVAEYLVKDSNEHAAEWRRRIKSKLEVVSADESKKGNKSYLMDPMRVKGVEMSEYSAVIAKYLLPIVLSDDPRRYYEALEAAFAADHIVGLGHVRLRNSAGSAVTYMHEHICHTFPMRGEVLEMDHGDGGGGGVSCRYYLPLIYRLMEEIPFLPPSVIEQEHQWVELVHYDVPCERFTFQGRDVGAPVRPGVHTQDSTAIEDPAMPGDRTLALPVIEAQSEAGVRTLALPAIEASAMPGVRTRALPAIEVLAMPGVRTRALPAIDLHRAVCGFTGAFKTGTSAALLELGISEDRLPFPIEYTTDDYFAEIRTSSKELPRPTDHPSRRHSGDSETALELSALPGPQSQARPAFEPPALPGSQPGGQGRGQVQMEKVPLPSNSVAGRLRDVIGHFGKVEMRHFAINHPSGSWYISLVQYLLDDRIVVHLFDTIRYMQYGVRSSSTGKTSLSPFAVMAQLCYSAWLLERRGIDRSKWVYSILRQYRAKVSRECSNSGNVSGVASGEKEQYEVRGQVSDWNLYYFKRSPPIA